MPSDYGAFSARTFVKVTASSQPEGFVPPAIRCRTGIELLSRLATMVRIGDWTGICVLGLLVAAILRVDLSIVPVLGIVLGATLAVNGLQLLGAYTPVSLSCLGSQSAKVLMAWTVTAATLLAGAFLVGRPREFFSDWPLPWLVLAGSYLLAVRYVLRARVASWQKAGRLARTIAIVGDHSSAVELAGRLDATRKDARIVGIFSADADVTGPNTLAHLSNIAREGMIDEVIFVLPWRQSPQAFRHAIELLASDTVEIRVEPATLPMDSAARARRSVGGSHRSRC